MFRWVAIGLLLVTLSSAATAQEVNPSWKRKPTPSELLTVWPSGALRQGLGGKALISCQVTIQGTLMDCSVVEESPRGMGFGAAAIALTPQFLMTPAMKNGRPVAGAIVRIPIIFGDPGDASTGSHLRGANPIFDNLITIIADVPWLEAPTYADVAAAYPTKARERTVGGHLVLNCRFKSDGRLRNCTSESEQPTGLGFGEAAKRLASHFLGPRTFSDGKSVENAETHIPFTFATEMLTDGTPMIGKPRWVRLPEVSAMAGGFPKAATDANVRSGRVALSCRVGVGGRLSGCSVVSQDPAAMGFDVAALALASDFQVSIWTNEGLPTVGGSVRVPLHYVMPEAPAGPAGAPR